MIDALTGSMTAFDLAVIAVIILSALMGLSRGFMRELGTIAALFFASLAAYFGRLYFRDSVAGILPETMPSFYADIIIIAIAFIVTYIIVRTLGARFSKMVQGAGEITMVDRLTGGVFGVVRGLALPFIFAWFLPYIAPTSALPDFISKSATYPYFERAVAAMGVTADDLADQVDETFEAPGDSPQDTEATEPA